MAWTSCRVPVFYLDNEAARSAFIHGVGATTKSQLSVKRFVTLEHDFKLLSWLGRVPTHSNVADGPSRLEFNPWPHAGESELISHIFSKRGCVQQLSQSHVPKIHWLNVGKTIINHSPSWHRVWIWRRLGKSPDFPSHGSMARFIDYFDDDEMAGRLAKEFLAAFNWTGTKIGRGACWLIPMAITNDVFLPHVQLAIGRHWYTINTYEYTNWNSFKTWLFQSSAYRAWSWRIGTVHPVVYGIQPHTYREKMKHWTGMHLQVNWWIVRCSWWNISDKLVSSQVFSITNGLESIKKEKRKNSCNWFLWKREPRFSLVPSSGEPK